MVRLRCRYLVGCDGGRSLVRKACGVAFEGTAATLTGHQAIVTLSDERPLLPLGWKRTARGMYAYGPVPGRMLTLQFDGGPARGHARDAPVTREELQQALCDVSGVREVRIEQVHSATRFTDNARLVADYRHGRVLLAGDAAHVHSPFGGQGVALGVGDAFNLGWKLAAVVRRSRHRSLRRPHADERQEEAGDKGEVEADRVEETLMKVASYDDHKVEEEKRTVNDDLNVEEIEVKREDKGDTPGAKQVDKLEEEQEEEIDAEDAALLDSYTHERRGVAHAVLENTRAQVALMRPDAQSGACRELFARLMALPEVNRILGEMMLGIDVCYPLGTGADGDDGGHALLGTLCENLVYTPRYSCTREQQQQQQKKHQEQQQQQEQELQERQPEQRLLFDLLRDGSAALLDASDDGRYLAAATDYASTHVQRVAVLRFERRDLTALLVRPDGAVAWAIDGSAREESTEEFVAKEHRRLQSMRVALRRWFGVPYSP